VYQIQFGFSAAEWHGRKAEEEAKAKGKGKCQRVKSLTHTSAENHDLPQCQQKHSNQQQLTWAARSFVLPS